MRRLIPFGRRLLAGSLVAGWVIALQAADPVPAPASSSQPAAATAASAGDAEKAWAEVLRNGTFPQPPKTWETVPPPEAEVEKFRATESARLARAAAQAAEFYTRFAQDPRVEEAKAKEYELLSVAAQLGNTNVLERLESLEAVKLNDRSLPEEDRFHIAATAANRRALAKMPQGRAAALAELEKGARSLLAQFPNRTETYEMLQMVALESEPEKAVQLAKEISASNAPAGVKEAVKPLRMVGQPLGLQFKAVDGREVDLAKMRGKVVLVDFWATWCGPCVEELPNVLSAYEKLNPKGFEIVGISFDKDKDRLLTFVKDHKMTWLQYFDGKVWENEFGKQFGIQGIPAMWLVDKKGILRDINARNKLAERVERLLAENP